MKLSSAITYDLVGEMFISLCKLTVSIHHLRVIMMGIMLMLSYSVQAQALPTSTIKNNIATYELSCPNNAQRTTLEMNQCSITVVQQLLAIQEHYIAAIYTRINTEYKDSPELGEELLTSFDKENKAWDELINASSSATYTYWQGGTIRGVKGLGRKITLIKYRIHNQWANWLTYMDSTPSILPEPLFIDK